MQKNGVDIMTINAKDFHTRRRAFIITDDVGILFAQKNSDISHERMLSDIGLSSMEIPMALATSPRGYFMNDELCIYQGYKTTPGTRWELDQEGKEIVRKYTTDLRAIFKLNDESVVYTGVVVGKIGEEWKKINKTTIKELENQNTFTYPEHTR